ncbi:MAG TPA: CehA/McbA family metallohydrolase [Clostridiales bacterium]|nr:CehA/McbA family metallohydrolase [Clostridiales bacterium]
MEHLLQKPFVKGKKALLFTLIVMAVLSFMVGFAGTAGVYADCGVSVGPTAIFEGRATGAHDLTVYNDEIAFSIAVDSNNYWNMTKGSILDVGIRGGNGVSGDMGVNIVNDIEFLNDLWTATGTYDGTDLRNDIEVDVTENTKDKVVITVHTRYWVADADKDGVKDETQFGALQKPINVTIAYTLEDGNNHITLGCVIDNPDTNEVTYQNMYSGFSLTTQAASMFGPYGFYPDEKLTGIAIGSDPAVEEYFGNFVVSYSNNYAVSLEMDNANAYKGSTGYKDLYTLQDLVPGETYHYVGEALISDKSETATLIDRYIARENISTEDYSTISGKVLDSEGNPVTGAYVIAEKDGVYAKTPKSHPNLTEKTAVGNMQPFVWDITDENGEYAFRLPNSGFDDGTADILNNNAYTYKFKVEAAGYTSVTSDLVTLIADTVKDFTVEDGAKVILQAKDENGFSIPFKVSISGVTSEMKTLGGTTYFSDALDDKDPYTVSFTMTKGKDITFTAYYGTDFESKAAEYKTDVTADGVTHTFTIPTVINPETNGWYCADNHQHSDFGDGATTAKDLFRAEIAAKLDFITISDHDARVHNEEMGAMAKAAGIPFLSNIEVSPGWGHWGLLGVSYGAGLEGSPVDATIATPQDIIKAGHDDNAVVIVHHPYSDYGFLNNQASVKGGSDEGWDNFDLLEIQPTVDLTGVDQKLTDDAWSKIDLDHLNQTITAAGIENMDAKTFVTAMAFWNQGVKKYFSAGSDQHDATSTTLYPGIIRMYAHLGDGSVKATECTTENYLKTLKSGAAYVSEGPILMPDRNTEFGSTQIVKDGGTLKFSLKAESVNGLSSVTLWSMGKAIQTVNCYNTLGSQDLSFTVKANGAVDNLWYSFTAVDAKGNYAFSNPVWVKTSDRLFSDVPTDNWAAMAIYSLAGSGYVNGYPNSDKFLPAANITRAEFCQIIAAMGDFTATGATAFSDVKSGVWYYDAVTELANAGIIQGVGHNKFDPNAPVTREQMFKIIAGAAGIDMKQAYPAADFKDMENASAWAKPYINALAANDLIHGYKDHTIRAKATATRAEACQIIFNTIY